MSKQRAFLFALATLIVGLVAGGYTAARVWEHSMKQFAAAAAGASVQSALASLNRLRAGKTNDVIELLEIRLNGEMLALEIILEEIPPHRRDTNSVSLLERARAYRAAHPKSSASDPGITFPTSHARKAD